MQEEKPTRRQEALIRSLRTRHGRKDAEHCLCDGVRSCSEILHSRPDLAELLLLREDRADALTLPPGFAGERLILSAADFDRLAVTVHSQGVMLLARRPPFRPPSDPVPDPFVLVLDRIGDPGNFGTILRTARAVGLHEVWITDGTADPFSDKAVRAASGAQFSVGLRCAGNLDETASVLRTAGFGTVFRTLPAGGENLFRTEDVFRNSVLVLGCEATGVAALAHSRGLHIPMPGDAESLNVAQAATVILFEYVRRIGA